ncbi:MAG: hypothetical protein ACOY90_09350 [Candidatus Zhuqueibacterota bacterium]
MGAEKQLTLRPRKVSSVVLWIISIALTIGCFTYQDKTGPTYPLEGELPTTKGVVNFKFQRSENIGTDLKILLLEPVPEGITGFVKYRRFRSHDDWSVMPMEKGAFEFTRRGRTETVRGMGAELPGLDVRAGKYEFFVYVDAGEAEPISVTGEKPVYARYKGAVPHLVLLFHILAIFASMALAIRTTLEALVDGRYKGMLWATIISFLAGGFVLGPWVQWYAFGVWWSGVPFGYDWTDNKVLVELVFWLIALFMNWGGKRNRWSIYLAGVVTLFIYFIPHSIFGSEYDFRTGRGRGTIG